jgi:hypothetical protein
MFSHQKLLIVGIICVLLISFSTAIYVEQKAQYKQATEFAQDVAQSLATMLKNDLEEWLPLHTLLSTIDDERRYLYLDEMVRHHLLMAKLEKIKFFNNHGIIIYAEKLELLGQDHSGETEIAQAFKGRSSSTIIDTKEYENVYGDVQVSSLIETYLPVFDNDGKVTHVMEVYQNFDSLKESIEATLLRTGAIITGILLMAFALISLLMKKMNALKDERDLLASFLPICSFCKKIRDDTPREAGDDEKPRWVQMEQYLLLEKNLAFSHGLCEECLQENYGEFIKTKTPTNTGTL